jgi:aminoglycoside phosphotransferase (APT) family kinase protein
MSESLAAELGVYLRAARDELLTNTSVEQDPFKPVRAQRLAAGLSHLLTKLERLVEAQAVLRPALDALIAAHSNADTSSDSDASARARLADLLVRATHTPGAAASHTQQQRFIAEVREFEAKRLALTKDAQDALAADDAKRLAQTSSELPPLTGEDVATYLRTQFPGRPIEIINFSRPTGVFSKEIYKFDVVGLRDDIVPAVLRRDRSFEIVPTSASLEFDLLNQLHAKGLPVARCIGVQYDDAAPLMRPCLLMERLEGQALVYFPAEIVTKDVLKDMARLLARLHQVAIADLKLPRDVHGKSGKQLFLETLADYHQRMRRFQREPHLVVEAAFAWLFANQDLIDDTTTLVHADYDLRNILFDGSQITAVLDFELSHIGHPGEDLAYLRKDIEHLIPWAEFMDAYHSAGGPKVSDRTIRYFQLWAYAFQGACNVTAFSGYRNGIQNDVFMGTLPFVEFPHIQNRIVELLRKDA